jgi:hypothetical protein
MNYSGKKFYCIRHLGVTKYGLTKTQASSTIVRYSYISKQCSKTQTHYKNATEKRKVSECRSIIPEAPFSSCLMNILDVGEEEILNKIKFLANFKICGKF